MRNLMAKTKSNGKAAATAPKVNLSRNDYRVLVDCVEVETNFEALHGDSGATAKDAFEMMLKHLKSKTLNKALAALTGRNMQQDWFNYMRRFRAKLKASESETGLSLTKRDLERRLINFNVIALMIRTVSPVEKPLVDKDNSFFFLKLVSRLPEHPVTETIIRELI
ncbi:hypothetical protein GQ600_581 [Phytophthora cactorum]|nr:hypothetical protein GQ600_581 [Phytophthora cactorum]